MEKTLNGKDFLEQIKKINSNPEQVTEHLHNLKSILSSSQSSVNLNIQCTGECSNHTNEN